MPGCLMPFPKDWHEFLKDYSFDDSQEAYTNGSRLIPVFRVEQLIEHLLKAQEPRAMTLGEVEDALDTVVWVDRPGMENMSDAYALISGYSRMNKELWLRYVFIKKPRTKVEAYGDYGIVYRCWTSRPTDEQREAVKWE